MGNRIVAVIADGKIVDRHAAGPGYEVEAGEVDLTGVSPEPQIGWAWDGKVATPPPAPPEGPRVAYGDDLIRALTDEQVVALGAGKVRDQRLLGAQRRAFPEDNPKIARLAAAAKTTPAAWFDAALGA